MVFLRLYLQLKQILSLPPLFLDCFFLGDYVDITGNLFTQLLFFCYFLPFPSICGAFFVFLWFL